MKENSLCLMAFNGHSLYNYNHAEYVSLKKIPFPLQISREGTDEKHMSFFWPNRIIADFQNFD